MHFVAMFYIGHTLTLSTPLSAVITDGRSKLSKVKNIASKLSMLTIRRQAHITNKVIIRKLQGNDYIGRLVYYFKICNALLHSTQQRRNCFKLRCFPKIGSQVSQTLDKLCDYAAILSIQNQYRTLLKHLDRREIFYLSVGMFHIKIKCFKETACLTRDNPRLQHVPVIMLDFFSLVTSTLK